MISKPSFIFVGAKQPDGKVKHQGGQLTASIGLYDYAVSQGYDVDIIDTLQCSFPLPPLKDRFKSGVRRFFNLWRLLRIKKRSGVIIFCGSGVGLYERILMAVICRLYHVKSMLLIRSSLYVDLINRYKLVQLFFRYLLMIPNVIGVQGHSWRLFYQNIGIPSYKLVTIRNWLSMHYKKLSNTLEPQSFERVRFCFLGWLVKEKGVLELWEAIKQLSARYDFDFVFIGGGTLEDELNANVRQCHLTERIVVTGWLEPVDVSSYLAKSQVFVLPSKGEGFPNALIEAFSLGLPAICTNVGAISDSLIDGHNGYLLPNGEAETIEKAMEKYLNCPDLIYQHSINARQTVQQQHDQETNCRLVFEQFGV